MTASRSVVVFDVGNVLIRWDPRLLYRQFFPEPAQMAWFMSHIVTAAWNIELDRGADFDRAVEELVTRHPEWEREIRAFDQQWHVMVPHAIDDHVALLDQLRSSGTPVYAITNFSAKKWAECLDRFAFLSTFDGVVVSAHERLIKPDPAIFRLFLKRYGLNAADCVFIDDSAKNIETAADLGFATVHVTDHVDVASALRVHGIAPRSL
ncbi:MAG: HAD family hydrolase [Hyphomicrobiaceae bacterium]